MKLKKCIGFGLSLIMTVSSCSIILAEDTKEKNILSNDEVVSGAAVVTTPAEIAERKAAEFLDTEDKIVNLNSDTTYAVEGGNIYFDSSTGMITGCERLVTTAVIPEAINGVKVTSIGLGAFENCYKLTSIKIPSSVTSIGAFAFSDCTGLTSIEIPSSVTSIEYNAFCRCTGLTSINADSSNDKYASVDGVLFNKDKTTLICYPPDRKNESYDVPSSVTNIEHFAFYCCSKLTSIKIPSSVTGIGYSAFDDCSSLTSIDIPNGVTCIEESTFSGCSSLTSIKIPSSVTSIEGDAFSGCSSLTGIELPSSVTSIGDNVFKKCDSLISIEIPNGVTSIGHHAFSDCSSLTSIKIPSGVTSIGYYAFADCSSLTSIELPSSVTSIEYYAFCYCTGLTSIKIPSGVTSIGHHAFAGCSSLTSIEPDNDNENYTSLDGVLFSKDKKTLVFYPEGLKNKSYSVPRGVTSIDSYAFSYCSSLTSIEIPSSVTIIESYVFEGCENLIIYCEKDSTAEYYAEQNNIKYFIIGGDLVKIMASELKPKNGEDVSVSMKTDEENAKIYYTTDGTEPTINSNEYTEPFTISGTDETIIIKAIIVVDDKVLESAFQKIKFGNYDISDIVLGDVNGNGVVDVSDASYVYTKAINDSYELSVDDSVADVDCNGIIGVEDCSYIYTKAINDSYEMPVEIMAAKQQ